MSVGQNTNPIPSRKLAEHYFENLHTAYRSMREVFALRTSQGLTQDELAARLDADKGLISKRLNGQENLTLKTLSAMASGLGCGLIIEFQPFENYRDRNYFGWKLDAKPVPPNPAPVPNKPQKLLEAVPA